MYLLYQALFLCVKLIFFIFVLRDIGQFFGFRGRGVSRNWYNLSQSDGKDLIIEIEYNLIGKRAWGLR